MIEFRGILNIAKKEFMDNWKNKWIVAITLIFLILALVTSYFGSGAAGWHDINATMVTMASWVIILISIISLMLGYASIVGEKEKGSLAILLSYPVDRDEVVIGKFLGLGSVVSLAILLGFGLAGIIIWANTGKMNGVYALFLVASILFGLAYLSIALLFSTLFKKRSTAMGAAIFIWFFFVMIWGMIILSVASLSGERVVKIEENTSLDIYHDETFLKSFSVDNSVHSLSYSNYSVYMLGNYIYKYNIMNLTIQKIPIPRGHYFSISSYDDKIFLAGNKAMEYDVATKKWHGFNISCNDIVYLNGNIFFLTPEGLIKYNGTDYTTISLPFICNFMTSGNNTIYLIGDKSVVEYNVTNGTYSTYKNEEMEGVKDIAYGNGILYILGERSYKFDTHTKDFASCSLKGIAISYGNGFLFLIEKNKKVEMGGMPSWYYISDFFNPVESYKGIIDVNLNMNMIETSYPSYYNNYTLILSLILWDVIPLIAAIYIFRRLDI